MTLGAVLAGGEARRFGRDKALATLAGEPLLSRAIALLEPVSAAVVVVGGARAGYDAVPDRPCSGLGPLGGLCGALHHAAAHGFAAVLTVPCDTPELPASALAALLDAGAPSYLAALPVAGLWPADLAEPLQTHLSGDDRSMRGWARACGARPITVPEVWRNINRPEDLDVAERDASSQSRVFSGDSSR